ncbi:MAG: hypothetical protein ABIN91_23820 [Mucilaginibacter sp.]|uniref:hypothetical protein n=1 Tax=Mucilaginibacter sp. TaxID=1882438 RepID=UPI0032631325
MKPNVELGINREFGDIISDSFVILKQNFQPLLKAYLVICGPFLVTGILVTIMFNSQNSYAGSSTSLFSFWGLLSFVFNILDYTALILTTLSYLVFYKEKGNQAPTIMEVWGYFRYYFFRVVGTQFLLTFGLIMGIIMCFIPGIYLLPILGLVIPVMVVENANAEYSIKRAFKIIKGNWWMVFGVILLLSIIVSTIFIVIIVIPAVIFYGGTEWLTGKSMSTPLNIAEAIIIHISQILWMLPIIGLTLVYYTLTEQKESNSLINRIKMFGQSGSGTDQIQSEQY